ERARPLRLDAVDDELVLPARGVEVEPPVREDRHSRLEREAQAREGRAPEHGSEDGVAVLEREVEVPRRRARDVGGLPLDPDVGEGVLEEVLERERELGDLPDPDSRRSLAGGRTRREEVPLALAGTLHRAYSTIF